MVDDPNAHHGMVPFKIRHRSNRLENTTVLAIIALRRLDRRAALENGYVRAFTAQLGFLHETAVRRRLVF